MTQDNLRDVIGLRMQLAREAAEMAEEYQDEVWARLCSRISGLEEDPAAEAETKSATPPAEWDGPERRRRPAEPMYPDAAPERRTPRGPRPGLAHGAGAALIAAAAAAAITLS